MVLSSMMIAVPGFSETPKKVAVCPLEMNAQEDLSFLQKGLFSMLFSRLADPGKVEVLDRETIDQALKDAKGPLNESNARALGKKLGVDYILFGSVTQFGKSVSLDMSMVEVKGEKPTLTFSKQAAEPGAVITEMDLVAAEINFKTFGRKPELIVPKEQYAQKPETGSRDGGDRSPLTNYRTLLAVNGEAIGIAAGDVDGDKKNEVVIVYKHGVEILKDNLDGRLVSVQKIDGPAYMDIVGVDVADINQNGFAEIFISRVQPASGDVKSFVLEYDGSGYKPVSKELPWYLRVVKEDSGRDILYAQKSGKAGPYSGKEVFKVNWAANAYVPGEALRVPGGFSVMSLAMGDVTGSNVLRAMFTDKVGRLTIFNENGVKEWSGEDGYGGSTLYYTYMEKDKIQRDLTAGDSDEGKGVYFQPRNIVFDMDSDGKKEVVVIKNKEAADGLFGQIRRFKTSGIEILKWSEMGLSPETAPKKLPGQVTDMVIADYDNNSKKEILITLIKNANNFSSEKSKSMIVVYDM